LFFTTLFIQYRKVYDYFLQIDIIIRNFASVTRENSRDKCLGSPSWASSL